MSAEANLADLERHADEFERRVAFAYTVLRPESDDVIGCLYLNPGPRPGSGRTCGRGSGPTSLTSIPFCDRLFAPGWRTPGRSTRSSTRAESAAYGVRITFTHSGLRAATAAYASAASDSGKVCVKMPSVRNDPLATRGSRSVHVW